MKPDEIEPWLRSVFAIACPHWRAQLIVWCVGAHPLLTGELAHIAEAGTLTPGIGWQGSNWLKGNYIGRYPDGQTPQPFLPEQHRMIAVRTIASLMSEEILLDWLISISAFDYLENELFGLPDRFQALYTSPR